MGEKQQKKKKQEGLANGQPFMNSPGWIASILVSVSSFRIARFQRAYLPALA
jgi:hypothetical protein